MAVAVKSPPEAAGPGALERMPVLSLVGVVYVLGSLGIIFKLLPALWRWCFDGTDIQSGTFAGAVLLGMVMVAGVIGLIALGGFLLGNKAPPGTKAGIFCGVV